jgi:hypothetical protein
LFCSDLNHNKDHFMQVRRTWDAYIRPGGR